MTVFAVFASRLLYWLYRSFLFTNDPTRLSAYGGKGAQGKPWTSWAMITGASDGIGAGFAKELAALGFNLFLVGRNLAKLDRVKEAILEASPQCKIHLLVSEASDVRLEAIQQVFSEVEKALSTHAGFLRILINNVGQGQGGKMRLADLDVSVEGREDTDIFEQIVMVNCGYPVFLTRAFLKHLHSRKDWNGNGRMLIVNVASCAALMPSTPFSSLYSASKAFNRSFSLSLASELAAKRLLHYDSSLPIDCVAVSPGFVESSMTHMSKSFICCTAQEHAKATLQAIALAARGGFWSIATDVIPHWKHALMWGIVKGIDWMIPHEPFVIGTIMPAVLKAIRRYRKLDIKD